MNDEKEVKDIDENNSTWASLCHFSALLGVVWWFPVLGTWIPFGQIIAPIGVWLFKYRTSPYVDLAGRLSLNFQLTVTLVALSVAFILEGIVVVLLIWSIVFFDIFCIIRAGVAFSNGKLYRYPVPVFPFFRTKSLLEDLSAKYARGATFL